MVRNIAMKSAKKTNFMQLTKSRHKPLPGDVFAGNILGDHWVVGRVIRSGFANGTAKNCILLYVYRMQVSELHGIEIPIPPDLLVPPFYMLSNMLWTRGMVIHLRNSPLTPSEVLSRHVFRSMSEYEYVNEEGDPVSPPAAGEVVGVDAFEGWASFDDEVSRALGLPIHRERGN